MVQRIMIPEQNRSAVSPVRLCQREQQRLFFRTAFQYVISTVLASVINDNQAGFSPAVVFLHDGVPVLHNLTDILFLVICGDHNKQLIHISSCYLSDDPIYISKSSYSSL